MAHAYNPSYLVVSNREHHSSRLPQQDPISKITRAKWTGGMVQAVEHLLCKCEALSSNYNPSPKNKIK
jgi:hypothetical protein